MSKNTEKSLAVLVNSCDKYSDLWPVFFHLFFKYWPDCPYPVYLGSNEKRYEDPRVIPLCVGPDKSWAESTQTMVSMVRETDILWFLDDYLLWEKVSTTEINDFYERFLSLRANYLRMSPDGGTGKTRRIIDDKIMELLPGAGYRASLDNAFWKRDMLLKILKDGETPWEMESLGSQRTNEYDGFYATRAIVFQRTNGVERGKWLRYNLPLFDREGIAIPAGRPVISRRTDAAKARSRDMPNYSFLRCVRFFGH
ncbi:MAG: hypothetical protein ACP5R6_03775 [Chlorobaculum sp.]